MSPTLLSMPAPSQRLSTPDQHAVRAAAARRVRRRGGGIAALVLGACACSGQSDSVLPGESPAPTAGAGGSAVVPSGAGGSPNASAGSSNTPPPGGSENSSVAGAGVGGLPVAGTSGAGGAGQPAVEGDCQPRSSVTLAVKATSTVSWPATLGTTAGSGDFVLLNVYRLSVNGAALTGTVSPCGSVLPPLTFSGLIGGGDSQIEIPDSVWETPGFPAFDVSGTIAGWEAGSAIEIPAAGALVGLTMADPTGPWPESQTDIDPVDADADGNPGITAIPATGDGLTSPPVSIIGPRVDQVHIVSRTANGLTGTFSSCTELTGQSTLAFFDNHVVGCRTVEGDTCNASQTDFVDVNRTIYSAEPGTFQARILPEGATCADARAALP